MIEVTLRRVSRSRKIFDLEDGTTIVDFKALLSNDVDTSGLANSNFAVDGNRVENSHVLTDGAQLSVVSKVDGGKL